MTYSLTADVPSPYGPPWSHMKMQEDERLPFPKWNHYDSGKTRPIAWFASHCNSATKRELFVRKLREHIEVDVYGACGSYQCKGALHDKTDICVQLLSNQYKFYLALENSYCEDYITEKFYRNLYAAEVVPIVFG